VTTAATATDAGIDRGRNHLLGAALVNGGRQLIDFPALGGMNPARLLSNLVDDLPNSGPTSFVPLPADTKFPNQPPPQPVPSGWAGPPTLTVPNGPVSADAIPNELRGNGGRE
jgi:hypothetical protein